MSSKFASIVAFVWMVVMATLIVLGVVIILNVVCAAAESDSLYFVSATDMIRQVDSVEAVCDTVETHMWIKRQYTDSTFLKWELDEFLEYEWIDREYGILRCKIAVSTIACREVLWVAVLKEAFTYEAEMLPYSPGGSRFETIPGQVLVRWREVVQ